MTSNKISKKVGRTVAPADDTKANSLGKSGETADPTNNGLVMDLVYNFLNDSGYFKATHGIRVETQKRETTKDSAKPASWMGKSKELPTLQQIFEQWQGAQPSPKTNKRGATVAKTNVAAENVPLPESEEDSDDSSEQSTSSGDESDDESTSASESESDSESDEDEEMEDAEDTASSAKKVSEFKAATIAAAPAAKSNLQVTTQKRKRSPSTSSSDASSESSDSGSDDSSSDESDDAPAKKKTKVAADSDSSTSEDESDDSAVEAAGVPLPESSDESSSDSEQESSSEDDSESEDEAPPAKAAKAVKSKPSKQATAAAKPEAESDSSSSASESDADTSSSDSDSEADSESESPVTQPTTNDTSSADDSKGSESSETLAHPSPDFQPVPTPADDNVHPSRKHRIDDDTENPSSAQKSRKKNNVPFSRIKEDTYVDQRFASNAFVPYDYAQKAHEKLIVTKGKGFTKEKNKGKRGSYRGGLIDIQGTKGIKFDD